VSRDGDGGGRTLKRRFAMVMTPHILGTVNIAGVAAMAPVIKRDLDLSLAEVGLFATAYTLCQAATGMAGGLAVDRIGIGWTLFTGFLLLGAGALVFSQADGLTVCLVGAGVMGVGYTCINPATAKAVLEWFPRNRRGTAMGVKQTGVPVGWTIGALALPAAGLIHWQAVLLVLAGVSVATGLFYLPMARRPDAAPVPSPRAMPLTQIAAVLRNRDLNAIEASTFVYHAAQQSLYSFTTLFFREALQASVWHASLALQLAQGGSIIARLAIGAITDFWLGGRRKPAAVIVCFVSALLCGAVVLLSPGPTGVYTGLVLFFLLGLSMCSASPIHQVMVVETVEPRLAGTAMGYHSTVLPAGKALGPPLFGFIADRVGYDSGWLMSGMLVLLAGVTLYRFFRERPAAS